MLIVSCLNIKSLELNSRRTAFPYLKINFNAMQQIFHFTTAKQTQIAKLYNASQPPRSRPPSVIIQFSVRFAKQFLRTREFSSGCECMKTQSLCLNQQNFDSTRLLREEWSAKERIGNKVS